MATNTNGTFLIKQFTDHTLFFGSTGLVGSLTLKELRNIYFQLSNKLDIQQKIDSCEHLEVVNFRFDKFIYCINRNIKQLFNDNNEQFMETQNVGSIRYNGKDYSFDRLERLTPGDPVVYEKPATGIGYYIPETINIKEDCIDEILDFRVDQQRYQAEYVSDSFEKIHLMFNINVVQITSPDSTKWSALLPLLFSGCVDSRSRAADGLVDIRLPPLDEIPTMICALGSNSSKKSASRNYVDNKLTFQLVKAFNNCERKRLVIVTTFNNVLISHIFPYFKTKSRLEYDLQYKLAPRLGHLILLRPGPLVGDHADTQEKRVTTNKSSNMLKQILFYKQCCFHCKLLLFKECRRTGFKTKASEIIAKSMYRKPGSWILGYCIPATKVAHTAALKAIEPHAVGKKHLVEMITSEEMDRMVSS